MSEPRRHDAARLPAPPRRKVYSARWAYVPFRLGLRVLQKVTSILPPARFTRPSMSPKVTFLIALASCSVGSP